MNSLTAADIFIRRHAFPAPAFEVFCIENKTETSVRQYGYPFFFLPVRAYIHLFFLLIRNFFLEYIGRDYGIQTCLARRPPAFFLYNCPYVVLPDQTAHR